MVFLYMKWVYTQMCRSIFITSMIATKRLHLLWMWLQMLEHDVKVPCFLYFNSYVFFALQLLDGINLLRCIWASYLLDTYKTLIKVIFGLKTFINIIFGMFKQQDIDLMQELLDLLKNRSICYIAAFGICLELEETHHFLFIYKIKCTHKDFKKASFQNLFEGN